MNKNIKLKANSTSNKEKFYKILTKVTLHYKKYLHMFVLQHDIDSFQVRIFF